jgi:hypothetical protein
MVVSSPFPIVSALGVFPFRVLFPSGLVVICYCTLLGFHCVPWHSFNNNACLQLPWIIFALGSCNSLVGSRESFPLVRCLVHSCVALVLYYEVLVDLAPLFCVFCALPSFAIGATD